MLKKQPKSVNGHWQRKWSIKLYTDIRSFLDIDTTARPLICFSVHEFFYYHFSLFCHYFRHSALTVSVCESSATGTASSIWESSNCMDCTGCL